MNEVTAYLDPPETPPKAETVLNGEQLSLFIRTFLKNAEIIASDDSRDLEVILVELQNKVKEHPLVYVAAKKIIRAIKEMIEQIMAAAPPEKVSVRKFDNIVPFSTKKFFLNEADSQAKSMYEKVVLICQEYEHYSHLNDEEIAEFERLAQAAQAEKSAQPRERNAQVLTAHYNFILDKFRERADQEFLGGLHKVHWFMNIQAMRSFFDTLTLGPVAGGQWELSTVAYDEGEQQNCSWGMGIGVELQGATIWAANSDSRSDNKVAEFPNRKFTYGDNQGLILGKSSFLRTEDRIHWLLTGPSHNELIIRDWQPVRIVVDQSKLRKQFDNKVSSPADDYDDAMKNLTDIAHQAGIEIKVV